MSRSPTAAVADLLEPTRHEQLSTSTTSLAVASAPKAAFEVTTLADVVDAADGVLSLREAITAANATAGADAITFADAIRGGTITLTQGPLVVTDDLVIDGDPANAGAGGIVIDGAHGSGGYGFIPFGVAGAQVRLEDLTVQNGYSAGIEASDATLEVVRSAVNDTHGPATAFGIRGDGALSIVDSVIDGTRGYYAGAAAVRFEGDVAIEGSTISGTRAYAGYYSPGYGGISVQGNVQIFNSAFVDNLVSAVSSGNGGSIVRATGSLTIENSSFLNNGSLGGPGATRVIDGRSDLQIVNSTFAGNGTGDSSNAAPDAAVIRVWEGTTAIITNTTLTGSVFTPYASPGSELLPGNGLYAPVDSQVTVANSIIDDSFTGIITSNGGNTFRDAAVNGAGAADRLGVRAGQLFALTEEIGTSGVRAGVAADNGGPTPTVALLDDPANPALDAADPTAAPATDQRGFLRDATPDIGAFELNGTPPLVVTTLEDVVDANDGVLSLREAVLLANANLGLDAITFADSIRGGTIMLDSGVLRISDHVVIDGGGSDGAGDTITIDGGVPSDPLDDPSGGGGAFQIDSANAEFRDLMIQNSYFAIRATESHLVVDNVTLTRTTAPPSGLDGVIELRQGSLELRDSVIFGASGEEMMAIRSYDADVLVERSTISRVSSLDQSIALGFYGDGRLRLIDSTIADISGPIAFGIRARGDVEIVGSTLARIGSMTDYQGGALAVYGDLRLVNSTIADTRTGNESFIGGPVGAIVVRDGGTATIVNSTITGSSHLSRVYAPAPRPALVLDEGGSASLTNSIVDGSIVGQITSNGANTFSDAQVIGARATDRLGVTAQELFALTKEIGDSGVFAGVLADNGGPTQTVALLDDPANPAVDAADPADAPLTDQRGVLRDPTPDIGAFELGARPAIVVTTLADVVDAADGVLSLREAITEANVTPGLDTITFADTIRGGTIALDAGLGTLAVTDDVVIDGDPLDGGAGGIVIDGGRDVGLGGVEGILPIAVQNAGARFEDLTVQRGLGYGISGSDAAITVERAWLGTDPAALSVSTEGGGISVAGGSLLVHDTVIRSYDAGGGSLAALALAKGAAVAVENSTVDGFDFGTFAAIKGDGSVLIDRTTVSGSGEVYARGIDVTGALVLQDSFVTAKSGDPGTYGVVIDGTFQITNSTIADVYNRDPFSNFPLDITNESTGVITNSTIGGWRLVRPQGPFPPPLDSDANGVRIADTASVRFENTIVDEHIIGTITSNGGNIFRDAAVDGAVAGDLLGARAEDIFADVALIQTTDTFAGRPADNGGPTPTIALLDDGANPAVGAADPASAPATDQRGFLRDATPDIGAFELGAGPPPAVPPLPPLAEKVPLADAEIVGVPRAALTLAGGDAAIAFVDEYAAFQNSLGVYLVGPDGTIGSTAWVFEQVEHEAPSDLASDAARPGGGPLSPGDAVRLSDLFDPAELGPGTEFGLFLVADGWKLNPEAVFAGGTLEFRTGGDPATITDTTPKLVHLAADGRETLVRGDILHTVDAGSPNPLSNTLNPGGTGQVTSGLLDGAFTVAFEDKPLNSGSDRDFNDALFAVDVLEGGAAVVGAATRAAGAGQPMASLQTLVLDTEVAA